MERNPHQPTTPEPSTPDVLPTGFTTASCFLVACRTCNGAFDEESEGVYHFPSIAAAADALTDAGWWLTQDGVQCDMCAAKESCARYGHAWEPWRLCRCGGRIPVHFVQMDVRHCVSCQAHEERPATACAEGDR
ncbi:hypothetical protein [Amycolatopsis magusensis]|uniref:hypothetical protein n=1 Tax=Amycolatopsis magusensis TaxID=882444 RepID=UPI0037B00051